MFDGGTNAKQDPGLLIHTKHWITSNRTVHCRLDVIIEDCRSMMMDEDYVQLRTGCCQ